MRRRSRPERGGEAGRERGLTRDINKTGWMDGTRYNFINSGWESNKREVEGLVWGGGTNIGEI